jgi:hypothetical protein
MPIFLWLHHPVNDIKTKFHSIPVQAAAIQQLFNNTCSNGSGKVLRA